MQKSISVAIGLLPLAAAMPGFAHKDGEHLYLLDLQQLLDTPVTSSTLSQKTVITAPSPITAFNANKITVLGFRYLHELANIVPGFQSQRSPEFGPMYSYSARGRRNGSQSKEILLLIDGRLFNSPRTGSTNEAVPLIPLDQIERVEFIRGPGSALYGTNAYTGVISIVTKQQYKSVRLETGSNQNVLSAQGFAELNTETNASAYVNVKEHQGETYTVPDTFSNSQIKTADPYRELHADFTLNVHNTTARLRYDYAGTVDFYITGNIANNINQSDTENLSFQISQMLSFADHWHSNIDIEYLSTSIELDTQLSPPGAFTLISNPASISPLLGTAVLSGENYRVLWRNRFSITQPDDLQFGIEYRYTRDTDSSTYTNFALDQLAVGDFPIDSATEKSIKGKSSLELSSKIFGAYIQYQRPIADTTDLTLGLRYDHYDDAGDNWSPRLGVVHQLNEQHTFKLLYGEAFRAPAKNETSLINNPSLVGNQDLTHETVETWDVIWVGQWSNTLLSVDGFYNRFHDPIAPGFLGMTRTFVQLGVQERQGVELELHQQFTDYLSLRATYTELSELNHRIDYQANRFGSLVTTYSSPSWDSSLSAIYHGTREMLTVGNIPIELDSYWFLNGQVRYKPTSHWTLSLALNNLTDKEYQSTYTSNTLEDGVPNRGREWLLGIGYNF